MNIETTLNGFEEYLLRCGHSGAPKAPNAGFESLLGFYRDIRVGDVDLDADGDMLLFQWSIYDWGQGPHFEVGLVRQLIGVVGEDEDIWQLQLTYRFTPSDALRGMASGNRWCALPGDLPTFEDFIFQHTVLEAVGAREDGEVEIVFECAG